MIRYFAIAFVALALLFALLAETQRLDEIVLKQRADLHKRHPHQ